MTRVKAEGRDMLTAFAWTCLSTRERNQLDNSRHVNACPCLVAGAHRSKSCYCHYRPTWGLGNLRFAAFIECGSQVPGSLSRIETENACYNVNTMVDYQLMKHIFQSSILVSRSCHSRKYHKPPRVQTQRSFLINTPLSEVAAFQHVTALRSQYLSE
jgi:hypothetical protein